MSNSAELKSDETAIARSDLAAITAGEQHFNILQSNYRRMASVWLLATFAAAGVLLSQPLPSNFPRELLLAGDMLGGAIGLLLLWVIDLLVYHRLLDAYFVEGLLIEHRYTSLPQVRHNMIKSQKGQGVLARAISFYSVPVFILLSLSGFCCSLFLSRSSKVAALAVDMLTIVIAIAVFYVMWRRTGTVELFNERLKGMGLNKLDRFDLLNTLLFLVVIDLIILAIIINQQNM